jgi:mono/diheme cytochrome c family protein
MRALALLALLALPAYALERPESADVAQNYVLFCAGCHGPNGQGAPGKVPALAGRLGKFLTVEGGRSFLLQVPGVRNSQLSSAAVAAVMNQCVERFATADEAQGFVPYRANEVDAARREPLLAMRVRRTELLQRAGVVDANGY